MSELSLVRHGGSGATVKVVELTANISSAASIIMPYVSGKTYFVLITAASNGKPTAQNANTICTVADGIQAYAHDYNTGTVLKTVDVIQGSTDLFARSYYWSGSVNILAIEI